MYIIENKHSEVVLTYNQKRIRIFFVTEAVARITVTEGKLFENKSSLIVTSVECFTGYTIQETNEVFEISTSQIKLVVSKNTAAITYFDKSGKLLLRELESGGKSLTPKKIYRNVFREDAVVDSGQSVDGVRAAALDFENVFDRDAFEAKLEFQFSKDEAIFGLGSHEEGYGNLRGKERLLYQQNMKITVPYFVSTKGYGVLMDCGSLMTFRDNEDGACWWADVVDELDFYFISGGSFDEVTKNLHILTGKAPMLPKWAFGFAQSKERYVNAKEIIDVVLEYRKREIPLDLIILDWKSWPNGQGWGQKSFDPLRFPDPKIFTDKLHALGARLMVSMWPIMTGDCPNQIELKERNLMLGNQATYNAFLSEARDLYWEQANKGLFSKGVDGWWCDCTEPFEADWEGEIKPEPYPRMLINTEAAKKYLDDGQINSFSLPHSQGIYEGQRKASSEKRVVNLTRSGYAGQHRYATICWNGDICGTWESLRNCIPEGVNFCATGEPYWTVDIGGFFIKNDPEFWFWKGDYNEGCRGLTDMNAMEPDLLDTGCSNLGFWELYTRWIQYGVFLPMFRSHGTDAAREIWRFGDAGNLFYDIIAKFIKLRYQLLPHVYSLAAQVTKQGTPMIRAVALDFPEDTNTHNITDQFLFGPSFLVCPVTTPMYYDKNSQPIENIDKSREVYLPKEATWIDFWTGESFRGGQTVTVTTPLEIIPLFVQSGSIVPLGPIVQYSSQLTNEPLLIKIYPGKDAEYVLYLDDEESYDYEIGMFSEVLFSYSESDKLLVISKGNGTFIDFQKGPKEFIIELLGNTKTNKASFRGDTLNVYLNKEIIE